jgi:microcystin-dependent protein
MANPYVGEIRCFGFNFAPYGWFFCDGALYPISTYQTLYALIGTTYGGDGVNTFGVPDLRGRVPMHQGTGTNGAGTTTIGVPQGASTINLASSQIPSHSHPIVSTLIAPGGLNEHTATPSSNAYIGPSTPDPLYKASTVDTQLNPVVIGFTGGSQPHENMQPYGVVNFCICFAGIFPSRN